MKPTKEEVYGVCHAIMSDVARCKTPSNKDVVRQHAIDTMLMAIKIAKHVRLRARNNTAFNNYMNRIFPYASFKTVTKQHADGTTYPGLQITIDGTTAEGEDDDAD